MATAKSIINEKLVEENALLRANVAIRNDILQSLYRRAATLGLGNEINTSPATRDYDQMFGYPEVINKMMYKRLFDRNGIAHRVVALHPSECWLNPPQIFDQDIPSHSDFEVAFEQLNLKQNCFSVLKRIDVLSGVGNYGVLLFGVSDGKELDQPVDCVSHETDTLERGEYDLLYMRPFQHAQVQIAQTEWDTTSPRFGQPTLYQIQMNAVDHDIEGGLNDLRTITVHWTRVLHVADNRETSELFGVPRMQLVYDNVLDIRKIRGSSAEMFYQGAYPGLAIEAIDDITSGAQLDMDSMRKSLELYANGMQRWFGLTNAHANSLSPQVQSPADHIRINLEEICIALGCPMRIFMGAEAAHLASDQDAAAWNNRLMERMQNYLTPYLVRPFLARLVQIGALPAPRNGVFKVEWNDLNTMTEGERYSVAQARLGLMQTYATTPELKEMISPEDMLQVFVGMSEEEAEGILRNVRVHRKERQPEEIDETPAS
jgi:hypothetical protein